MEQNSISGFNSAQESFQNSGEGTKVKPCNIEIGHFHPKLAKKLKITEKSRRILNDLILWGRSLK